MTSAVYPLWNLAIGFPFPRPAAGLTLCSHLPGHVALSEAHHLSTSRILAGEVGLATAWPAVRGTGNRLPSCFGSPSMWSQLQGVVEERALNGATAKLGLFSHSPPPLISSVNPQAGVSVSIWALRWGCSPPKRPPRGPR